MVAREIKGEKANRVHNSSDAAACCIQIHYYGLARLPARPLVRNRSIVRQQADNALVSEETERDSRKGQIPHNTDPFERR